jgi:hypothetical protein
MKFSKKRSPRSPHSSSVMDLENIVKKVLRNINYPYYVHGGRALSVATDLVYSSDWDLYFFIKVQSDQDRILNDLVTSFKKYNIDIDIVEYSFVVQSIGSYAKMYRIKKNR